MTKDTTNKKISCEKAFNILKEKSKIPPEELKKIIINEDDDQDSYLSIEEFSNILKKLSSIPIFPSSNINLDNLYINNILDTEEGNSLPFYNKKGKNFFEALFPGAVAGACAKTVIAPFDRLKILYQVSPYKRFSLISAINSIYHIIKSEGILSLWKGNLATMIRVIPQASILFFALEKYKNIYSSFKYEHNVISRFICGSMASITASICTYPLDLMRARMACQMGKHVKNSYLRYFKKTITNEGILGLYKGLKPTLIGYIPYGGLSFAIFETLKSHFIQYTFDESSFQVLPRVISGALAGIIAQSVTYPLDIVRRRMQVDDYKLGSKPRYLDTFQTLKIINSNEGIIRGLYKGLSLNWIKGPIAVAVSFTVNDFLNVLLKSNKYR